MEPRKSTLTADGQVGEQTFETPNITLGYSKKVSDGNYGGAEASLYYQIEVPLGATEAEKASLIEHGYTLVRNLVNKQVGAPMEQVTVARAPQTPNEARIAEDLGGEIVSINERKKTAAPRKKIADKRVLWENLQANPGDWWDNRMDKRNPLAPDFKHKKSGEGLWLSDKPEDILL